jgi:hypothetical protein
MIVIGIHLGWDETKGSSFQVQSCSSSGNLVVGAKVVSFEILDGNTNKLRGRATHTTAESPDLAAGQDMAQISQVSKTKESVHTARRPTPRARSTVNRLAYLKDADNNSATTERRLAWFGARCGILYRDIVSSALAHRGTDPLLQNHGTAKDTQVCF